MNKAAVDYFFVELRLEAHLEALRHFLLMEDGEFAQSLSDLLFEKVTLGVEVAEGQGGVAKPGEASSGCLTFPAAWGWADAGGASHPAGA